MSRGASEQEQRRGTVSALERAQLTLDELWVRYFAFGGVAGRVEVEAYLLGMVSLDPGQRDMLAHAVNERLAELAPALSAPYSHVVREGHRSGGPLAALVELLDGALLAVPEDLPAVVAAAGRALDATIVVYLADDAQRELTPLAVGDAVIGPRLGVDATPAGRAYRDLRVVPGQDDGRPRLWVPLVDGSDRLGVLEVLLDDAADVHDPLLHDQLGWLSAGAGHLVTVLRARGGAPGPARPSRRRTPGAELVRSLLPPLTATTAAFSVSGLVEPGAEETGGDAFDYTLGATTVGLALFDTGGRGVAAALLAAAALASSRSARRDGRALVDQGRAVDEAVGDQFRGTPMTGVLAELDVASGRLRYLVAGPVRPVILRGGQASALAGGGRSPFGVTGEASLPGAPGEALLRPGDWLVLHSDGVTGARDADGTAFGDDRLNDLLQREAAAGHRPAETVRRLLRAVLTHQQGPLRDDATVLLARWEAGGVPSWSGPAA